MTLNEYQEASRKTALYKERVQSTLKENGFLYLVMGLAGESGEVSDKVKKLFRDHEGILNEERRQELGKELGDILWYVARLAEEWNFSLKEIAEMNIAKLMSRKERDMLHGNGDNR